MLVVETRPLLLKLNTTCTRALASAASMCTQSRHYEITTEHLLLALIDDPESDVTTVLGALGLDQATTRAAVQRALSDLRSGNAGKPSFSPLMLEWIQDAWLYGSTELGETKVRSGALLVRLAASAARYTATELPIADALPRDELRKNVGVLAATSGEAKEQTPIGDGASAASRASGEPPKGATALGPPDGALARFTSDLTERAKKGELDPVFGREPEIRQLVDILSRRRKNNPCIVGEPGVGKTALVEGLAIRIAEGSVPELLRGVHLLVLDLGALQAGAGVKGEFENRLKGVISEVKASPKPIVLFIDEAHTIIGAGGPQGGGDAANLLKPALARGELRTIAATTWAEYKKYFEKDAALERRFQPVKVDEPTVENATLMLRGLAKRFEEAHGIIVQDDAVRAAVSLSSRYISGRQLPDKAVDLLDTSAARVKVLRAAAPAALEDAKAEVAGIVRHLEAVARDVAAGLGIDEDAKNSAVERKAEVETQIAALEAKMAGQRAIVERIDALRKEVGEGAEAKRPELRKAIDELKAIPSDQLLVHADVDPEVIASVVGDWTGIPVGKMVKDDIAAILDIEPRLRARVRGQDHALDLVSREIRAARSGLKSPTQPIGVFLLVGPSGVGKTETALALADVLFGGDRFMCTINMSEFQERHTVSRLIGSPPGYVGFGEGGVLTEAVRQRPYSLVLLDEVEKADRDVLNLFYQVFDKGMLADGEGRVIDFKNTVLILTSNLATDLITSAADPSNDAPPSLDDMVTLIRPTLSAHFKPALLARMTIVPYYPIRPEALLGIVRMKLKGVAARAKDSHGIELGIDDAVVDAIASRCREVESGARNADHIIRGSVLPVLSAEILKRLADGSSLDKLRLSLDAQGTLVAG
jgi:type VI secretion system protein VasG